MRKIVVVEFLTLDGVMQGPGGPDEDRSGGFDRGGWTTAYGEEMLGAWIMKGFDETGGLLLGRRTCDIFANYWPKESANNPLAATINAIPKWVVSTTLQEPLSWQNSTLISDDIPGAVQAQREGDGKLIQVIGSGELVQTLIRHDLVDEYRLMIYPIVVGEGKRSSTTTSRRSSASSSGRRRQLALSSRATNRTEAEHGQPDRGAVSDRGSDDRAMPLPSTTHWSS